MKISFQNIQNFILTRFKKEEGGFGATLYLPPTIEDTYFAIKGLVALHFDFSSFIPKILQFLLKSLPKTLGDPINLYRIIYLFKVFKKEIPDHFINEVEKFFSIKSLYKLDKSKKIFAMWWLAKNLRKKEIAFLIERQVEGYSIRTIEDLFYLGKINLSLWKNNVEMVVESQNGDGGFGFYPGTTSFLENTYFALKILSELSLEREFILKGVEFIKACYNSDGGFGRKPGGISFMETTSYACEIISSNLDLLDRGDRI